jgi:UDP-N-acetyl-D-mannosaminuronic acid transferase (WecB/TagA/CpsF family)
MIGKESVVGGAQHLNHDLRSGMICYGIPKMAMKISKSRGESSSRKMPSTLWRDGNSLAATMRFQQILGIRFVVGGAQQVIDLVSESGGLVVVPAGPAMCTLASNPAYREALLGADIAIADSAYMVLLWNLLYRPRISKLSGFKYLRALLLQEGFRSAGATFWVMPWQESAENTLTWLRKNGIVVDPTNVYVAPHYNGCIQDPILAEAIERRRPRHVILGVGGGVQEPLGLYLKQNLSYLPAIHCIGAAIGFLTGDQVRIPVWTDSLGLGWLWRSLSNPRRFVPRYWGARHLMSLMLRYRDSLPVEEYGMRPGGGDGKGGRTI